MSPSVTPRKRTCPFFRPITSPEGVISYTYDPATGNEVRMVASHGGTVTDETDYAYDQQGRLTDVYAVVLQGTVYASFAGLDSNGNPTFTGGTPLTTAYTYDPLGNLACETDSDNTQTTYLYDVDNRLTNLTTTNTSTAKPIFGELYHLDDNGLRKDVTDTRYNADGSVFSQTEIAWTYDDDQRLTNETLTVLQGGSNAPSPYSDTFKYDLSNNRAEEDITGSANATVTYGYNGDDQLKTETRTNDGAYAITYGYDNNGSLTSQVKTGTGAETDSYTYDARNRMISATVNGVTTTYTYDDNGVRVSETSNGVTTYYLNDPQNPTGYTKAIEESTILNGAPARAYVIGRQIIAQKDSAQSLVYLVHDGHGSTRALLNSSGAVIERYNYNAFGTLLASNGAQSNASSTVTSWLFGGDGIYDIASGWTYQLARWRDGFHFSSYDPDLPMPSDPLLAGGYLFGSADPINNDDPSGRISLAGLLVSTTIEAILGATLGVGINGLNNYALGQPFFNGAAGAALFGAAALPLSMAFPIVGIALAGLGIYSAGSTAYHVFTTPGASAGRKATAAFLVGLSLFGGYGAVKSSASGSLWVNAKYFQPENLGAARMTSFQSALDLVTNYVSQLRDALDASKHRGFVTMAVGVAEDASGNRMTLVSMNKGQRGFVRPEVRPILAQLAPNLVIKGPGDAEANIVATCNARGWTLIGVGATRPICDSCAAQIAAAGATAATPLKNP